MLGSWRASSDHRSAMSMLTRVRDFFYEPAPAQEPPLSPEGFAATAARVEDAFAKALGGPVPEMPRTPPTKPVGSSGMAVYGGYASTNERSADLAGSQRYVSYENWKRTVAPIGAAVRTFLYLGGAPDWTVKPYKADDASEPLPEDVERAAWLHRQLHNMAVDWKRVVMEHLCADLDGARIGVWTAKIAGDRLGLDDVMTLPLATIAQWAIDDRGRVAGIIQHDPQTGAVIPIARGRLIYSLDIPTTTNPAGDGAMRFLADAIRRLQSLEKLRDKGFEKDVNGVPVIYAPIIEKMSEIGVALKPDGTVYTRADFDRDMAACVAFVSGERRKDAALILDSSTVPNVDGSPSSVRRYQAEIMNVANASHAELTKATRDLIWDILTVLGMEYLAMGRDNGTQAMHESKMRGALRMVSSALTRFAGVARRDLVRPLWILNRFDPANPTDPQNLPTLDWDATEFEDIASLASTVGQLISSGGIEPGRADDIIEAVVAGMGLPRLRPVDDAELMGRRDAAASAAGMAKQPIDPQDSNPDDLEM